MSEKKQYIIWVKSMTIGWVPHEFKTIDEACDFIEREAKGEFIATKKMGITFKDGNNE